MEAGVQFAVTKFLTNPTWDSAEWVATTFRWHPTGDAPPIMGIVFEMGNEGKAVFETWTKEYGNQDPTSELRISIVEGSPEGQRYGYSVHICPDPETILARATMDGVVVDLSKMVRFGRVNRMYPIPGQPNLLKRFQREFAKHKEYLLAPVTKRDDGQLWVDVELGIVKKTVHFRDLKDITESDIDAAALALPALITPPV